MSCFILLLSGHRRSSSTVLYLQDCAQQARQESRLIHIVSSGLGVGGVLTDLDDNVIQRGFKLYPLEWMMRDDNGPLPPSVASNGRSRYGSILSNKGLMPLLWRFFPVILTSAFLSR
ncbi:glutathionylspermidine synthase family protein [Shigella flexneri]